MDTSNQEPQKQPSIPGLICIISDGRRLVGKIDKKQTVIAKKNLGRDFVVLKDAWELRVQYRPAEGGGIGMEMIPLPFAPFKGRTTITVRVGQMVDVSEAPDLIDFDKRMDSMTSREERTTPSGLIIPPRSAKMLTPADQKILNDRLRSGR